MNIAEFRSLSRLVSVLLLILVYSMDLSYKFRQPWDLARYNIIEHMKYNRRLTKNHILAISLSEGIDIPMCLALTDLILWPQLHVSIFKMTQHKYTIYHIDRGRTHQC